MVNKKLFLNEEETKNLRKNHKVLVVRNGFEIFIQEDKKMSIGYKIQVFNPFTSINFKGE